MNLLIPQRTSPRRPSLSRFLIWISSIAIVGGQQNPYQCYLDENYFNTINMVPVGISYQCCADTYDMYNRNNNALVNELLDCATEVLSNLESFCDENFLTCTIDYHSFTCDDEFMRSCSASGGLKTEADIRFRCDDGFGGQIVMTFLNKVDCVAPSCTDEEILEVYKTAAAAMDCDFDMIDHMLVDGRESGLSYGSGVVGSGGGGGPKVESRTNGNSELSTGAIVGLVVGGLLVTIIFTAGLIYFLSRKSDRSTKPRAVPAGVAVSPLEQQPEPKKVTAEPIFPKIDDITGNEKVVKTVIQQSTEPDGTVKRVKTYFHSNGCVTEVVDYTSQEM